MPAHFFDTSAVVYRYFHSAQTAAVEALLAAPGPHYVSRLGVVEFHSTFAKLVRAGAISPVQFDRKVLAFEADVAAGRIRVMPAKNPRHRDATRLIRQIGMTAELASQDALQLAVALHLRASFNALTFVSCDQALLAAAVAVKLPTICP